MESRRALGASVLCRASTILGGTPALRKYLRVSALSLSVWMTGAEPAPTDVFLKAVDVIVDAEVQDLQRGSAHE
jgi:hypothetical protein